MLQRNKAERHLRGGAATRGKIPRALTRNGRNERFGLPARAQAKALFLSIWPAAALYFTVVSGIMIRKHKTRCGGRRINYVGLYRSRRRPCRLSAAINLHQRGKSCLVLSAGAGYLAKAERMDNYLGMPGMTGQEMLRQFGEHAAGMDIEVRTGRVGNILPFDGHFMVNFGGDMLESRSIILATGV